MVTTDPPRIHHRFAYARLCTVDQVSDREREVLTALRDGLTNAQIATRFHLSIRTVESHVSALLRKTGATDRKALAALASLATSELGRTEGSVPASAARNPRSRMVGELLGRDADLAAVQTLLTDHHLVTVVATGGCGKTSLALTIAATRRSAFADLSALPIGAGDDLVWTAVARGLGMEEREDRSLADLVMAHLAAAPALVVLDNCEHLLEGAATVADRLATCPGSAVLATSREALAVPGEAVHRLGPLDPDAAVALFLQRAHAVAPDLQPDASMVAHLCERLDRLPLAIELAAARLAVFDLDDLVRRLDNALDLLEGGSRTTDRHRSVRNAITWSHDLLTDADRMTHRRMSLLAGPSRLDTIEAVVGDLPGTTVAASVGRLCDASLVQRIGRTYRQLDLVRNHAREQLEVHGDAADATARFVAAAERHLAARDIDNDVLAAHEAALAHLPTVLDRFESDLIEGLAQHGRWTDVSAILERRAVATGDACSARRAGEMWMSRWRDDEGMRMFRLAMRLATDTGDEREWVFATATMIEQWFRFTSMMAASDEPDDPDGLNRTVQAVAARFADDVTVQGYAAIAAAWVHRVDSDGPIDMPGIDRLLASGLAPELGSSLIDACTWTIWRDRRIDEVLANLERRGALMPTLPPSYGRMRLEWIDRVSMYTDTLVFAHRLDDAARWCDRLIEQTSAPDMLWAAIARRSLIAYLAGDFNRCLDCAEQMRAGWEREGRPPAGYLLSSAAMAAAVYGYRGDERSSDDWFRTTREMAPNSDAGEDLCDAMRRDVHLHHGRLEQARADFDGQMSSRPTLSYSQRAAVFAEVFGGEWIERGRDEALREPYSAGILARAEGDLERALAIFERIGAPYQAARTALMLGGPRAAAAAKTYRTMGLTPP